MQNITFGERFHTLFQNHFLRIGAIACVFVLTACFRTHNDAERTVPSGGEVFVSPPEEMSIYDIRTFVDDNADGVWDEGEAPLGGIEVVIGSLEPADPYWFYLEKCEPQSSAITRLALENEHLLDICNGTASQPAGHGAGGSLWSHFEGVKLNTGDNGIVVLLVRHALLRSFALDAAAPPGYDPTTSLRRNMEVHDMQTETVLFGYRHHR